MTEKLVLDAPQAVAMLRKVVYGREDYVYVRPSNAPYCVNFTDEGQPSCVVGHVLAELGLTFEVAELLEIKGNIAIRSAAGKVNKCPDFGWALTEAAVQVLAAAQLVQDDGRTWGEALGRAEACADLHG